jgi:hypothetical protein
MQALTAKQIDLVMSKPLAFARGLRWKQRSVLYSLPRPMMGNSRYARAWRLGWNETKRMGGS